MEVKRDILWRVYLCFLGIVLFSIIILGRAIYIQQVQGTYWINQAKEQQFHEVEIDAQRGTIYSEDGNMLSTSIPFFDVYIDFGADGLQEKNGARFRNNIDSLSMCLANLFKDQSISFYRRQLMAGFKTEDRYYLLKRNISFQQYQTMRGLPLIRLVKTRADLYSKKMTGD